LLIRRTALENNTANDTKNVRNHSQDTNTTDRGQSNLRNPDKIDAQEKAKHLFAKRRFIARGHQDDTIH